MLVGSMLPVEIRPLETDVVLDYSPHWSLKAFADRLPNVPFNLSDIIVNECDPQKTLICNGTPHVHKYCSDSPGFMISPAFSGVLDLARALDLPNAPDDIYFSKFWTVPEFTGLSTTNYPEYDKYSIETVGVRVTVVPDFYPAHLVLSYPNRFNLPRYWLTSCLKLIQIRRVRVFSCPIQRWLKKKIYDPLTDDGEPMLCLEEQWHPSSWENTVIRGLTGKDTSVSHQLESFFRTARHILAGTAHRGRRQGTRVYPTGAEFYSIVRSIYLEMKVQLRRPPYQKEVFAVLDLSRSGFRNYWQSTNRSWPPIHPNSLEEF
jgi:hypothetical protein